MFMALVSVSSKRLAVFVSVCVMTEVVRVTTFFFFDTGLCRRFIRLCVGHAAVYSRNRIRFVGLRLHFIQHFIYDKI